MLPLLLVPALSLSLSALSLPNALLFEAVRDQQGRSILFIRDCGRGNIPKDQARFGVSNCKAWERGFRAAGWYRAEGGRDSTEYPGDAAELGKRLRTGRYDEVWLFSGGGSLVEGIEVGRLLRRHRAAVRVPNVQRVQGVIAWPEPRTEVACVSACTVAFMGGLFRYLDEGATYEVHSASIASDSLPSFLRTQMLRGDLSPIVQQQCYRSRITAASLLTHFQNALLLSTRYPQQSESQESFVRYAESRQSFVPYGADDEARDRARMASEGVFALQDIYMRIERRCIEAAIAELRASIASSGPRAGPALRMVEVMYDVSIKETATLTRETMLRMGYLTQEIDPAVRPEEER